MNVENSEKYISESQKNTDVNTTASKNSIRTRSRITEHYLIIWINSNLDVANEAYENILRQLQSIASEVYIFETCDECVDFLTEIDDRKVFLIVSESNGQQLVPLIHDYFELDSIYIYCSSDVTQENWKNNWSKIKGVYAEIMSVCKALKITKNQYNRDDISVSFVSVNQNSTERNLDQLEPIFMYTQLIKDILLNMTHSEQAITHLVQLWRSAYIGNPTKLKDIAQFERDYCSQSSIWWYSRECFLYETLNSSLRTLEAEGILKMGFFICDLHRQIEILFRQQTNIYHEKTFEVFRGQGLSTLDFEKLKQNKDGLISFNSFLSTSRSRDVSLCFAEDSVARPDTVGILFKMFIDPHISTTPFGFIKELSSFEEEDEILFSMHTVFRIDDIQKINETHPVYQVNLKITADDDQQLHQLTKRMEKEIAGSKPLQRLGNLLLKIGQLFTAENFYNELLQQTKGDKDRSDIYHQLGWVKQHQGKYKEAVLLYEKSLEIGQESLLDGDVLLGDTYSNLGAVYHSMGNHHKAIQFYEKGLKIKKNNLAMDHIDLASSYNSIGGVCESIGNYSKALQFHEKAITIRKKHLPPNHPDLATSYNNIGLIHYRLADYSKALEYFNGALQIKEKTLPSNHPDLAISYNNIGALCDNMGNHTKALVFHEKSLKIRENSLPHNHPELAASYNNIGGVYHHMGNYWKSLEFYEKVLHILTEALPPNHPSLGTVHDNIGIVHGNMGNYSKALEFYEKAIEIRERSLPSNHPDFPQSYNNIGVAYYSLGNYSKAIEFYEKALKIREETLPANHPELAISYNNIGLVYDGIGNCSKALDFFDKSHRILEISLPNNHPDLASSYTNIAALYDKMRNCSKALELHEKALKIREAVLPPNHPDLSQSYNNIGVVYDNMGDYSKALEFYKRTLDVDKITLPSNHPDIAISYNNVGIAYEKQGEYLNASQFFERAVKIAEQSLPSNHPATEMYREHLQKVKKML